MKKIFLILMLTLMMVSTPAFAGVDTVLNEIGGEFDTVGSWVYGVLFATVVIIAAIVGIKMYATGNVEMNKIIQLVTITVVILISITIVGEIVKPLLIEQAQSATTVKTGW